MKSHKFKDVYSHKRLPKPYCQILNNFYIHLPYLVVFPRNISVLCYIDSTFRYFNFCDTRLLLVLKKDDY
ncbi:hypothetical protein LEP1GSC188_0226 [Leptospira weilii serovar Topaz str. LT2116]|uniref:Uncharacterized protein n=1 Tax=Leptospira weilii serovar Topaz str. LT2116 TaxID=1088540 RepID=M3EN90_9LEPT|nr:hypothetical protein LEP1GSC188_0226 [Leptospira weilii serovar Topaz str. LT2116]